MGLFKIKGSSRADGTRAVFQPFSAHRRLSNIAEEEGNSEIDILEGSDSRETSSKRTPIKNNKNTPNRRNHRFQRLVEWDYSGTDATNANNNESEQYYEPPQDFLHVQKERGDHFFQNGPERSTMVPVDKSMTLEDARKANDKARGRKSKTNHGSASTLKIFQFAADTASLSKSCSSDSSVCSSSVASKGPFGAGFGDVKVVSSKPDNMKTSSLTAASSSSQSNEESNARMDKAGTKIPKLNAPRASGRSLFTTRGASPLVKTKKAVAQRSIRESEYDKEPTDNKETAEGWSILGADHDKSDGFTAFPHQTMQAGNQDDGFGGIDWPSGFTTHTESGSTNGSNLEWQTSEVGFDNHNERQDKGEVDDESSTVVERRQLVERTEALINDTKTLLREGGTKVDSKVRRSNINSPYEDNWSETEKQELVRDVQEGALSPFKENENSGPSFSKSNNIFRSKKVQFEKKLANPLTKIPSNDAEAHHGRPVVNFATSRVSKNGKGNSLWRKVPQTQPTREYFTPQRHKEPRSNVSFRFENENEGPRGYYSEPRHRVKRSNNVDSLLRHDTSKHNLPLKRALETSAATLGATPMESPDSMHLAVDIEKTSTIDSSDSQSTATSVSTFVEHSPRGIRGSFPTQTVQSSSSLSNSMSSVSTNILNEADLYKPSALKAGARRPPTGVPPTSIFGSMLFQAGEQDISTASGSKSISPKRDVAVRGVPHDIHAVDDATISDVTGSTAASEWMIQGNKLLSRYYYNNNDGAHAGASQKKQKISRRFRQPEERTNLEDYQNIMVGMKKERRSQQPQKRRLNGYVSEYNERNDPLDKMRRHQHQFQYPAPTPSTTRSVRSGFDNQSDDDASSLFEA